MHLGIRNEQAALERRVAAPPQAVESFLELGFDVSIERGAGEAAGFADADFVSAGATVVDALDRESLDVLVTVSRPDVAATAAIKSGGVLIGLIDPGSDTTLETGLAARSVTPIAMELIPRTTLAQSIDALSSQATAAGYAAVLMGATALPKFMPMFVTAAGTVPPARVLVLGVGVAGLQAIATAKRLGAIVYAYDIRPETKEQVESLGGRFVDAPTQEMDEGGYARAVDEDVAARQREILAGVVADSDLVITTAQVPGRSAPRLIEHDVVVSMKPGSLIIDMAAGSGGNVEGSRPDEEVVVDGVHILGPTDLASHVAADASRMYGRNLYELLKRMVTEDGFVVDPEDPIVGPAIVNTSEGAA
ncbi:MAG: NAD(P) transhydrogenase subunit alpha [Acidimicrobiia bacterium]